MSEFTINHVNFEADQKKIAEDSYSKLSAYSDTYLESYTRLTTMQAWSHYLVRGSIPENAFTFFLEAQNDALISHLLARQGMWRPSLQSLRSCLENILVCHFYADHPVELRLWELGEHRTSFSDLRAYFEAHPNFRNVIDKTLLPFAQMKNEYAALSKAVHGSSTSFLMGDQENMPNVYLADQSSLGQWSTRQNHTLRAINMFLLLFYKERLMGTALPMLRLSLKNVFDGKNRGRIKSSLSITI